MKKKNRFWIYTLIAIGIIPIISNSCKKEEEKKIPIITTIETTSITTTTATCGGSITSDGNATITNRGVCYSATTSPTTASSKAISAGTIGTFTCNLSNLTAGTTYYLRAFATNNVGTAYGNEVSFTTTPLVLPSLTTSAATMVTATTASCGGNVTSDGNATITERGICYGTTTNPTTTSSKLIATGTTGVFTCSLSGLTAVSTYYVRAYAINIVGTAYGTQISFVTTQPDGPGSSLTDVDGNTYNTIWIGGMHWMKENLKTTKYRDGTALPNITDGTEWSTLTVGAYCWYRNDPTTNKNIYGALYNGYTVVNSLSLCPTGWHIPTDTEWSTLTTYLGGESIAGGKLKATSLWASPNSDADNSSGFTALPSGSRHYNGGFIGMGYWGNWWSLPDPDERILWFRYILNNSAIVYRSSFINESGLSIRCIRD